MKEHTIHKQNSIIQGQFEEIGIYDIRCLNALYYVVQRNKDNLPADNTFKVELYDIREYMGMNNISNYSEIIKKSLNTLKKPFYTYDYRDDENNILADKVITIIKDFTLLKSYYHTYSITVHQDFIDVVSLEKNWTKLHLDRVAGFSSKYSLRLYEYLSSIKRQKYKEPLTLERLNKIFLCKHRHLSKVEDVIKRCIKDFKDSDLVGITYTKDKRRRTILFSFKFIENLEKKKQKDEKILQDSIEREEKVNSVVNTLENKHHHTH